MYRGSLGYRKKMGFSVMHYGTYIAFMISNKLVSVSKVYNIF